ncbi:MAG: hypothetical protein JSV12_08200, partial [Candidatus Bathyarchaeota archaeon]
NNITNNHNGIWLWLSSNNTIYHNNLVDNTEQVYSYNSTNVWDDGYPSGGNYWSNYTGVDLYNGLYQNETGSDGIGDTPHIIDTSNQDNYPFTAHDTAITNITLSKTVVGQGYNTTINITAKNVGHYPETFNITLYADKNSSIIGDEVVIGNDTIPTMTGGNSTTVTFTWNTIGVPYGNYTITATATPVPNETYTLDNTLTRWVVVTILGDADGSGRVVADDFFLLVDAFGARPGDPNWNPNCDFDGSGRVVADDFFILVDNFGKSWR